MTITFGGERSLAGLLPSAPRPRRCRHGAPAGRAGRTAAPLPARSWRLPTSPAFPTRSAPAGRHPAKGRHRQPTRMSAWWVVVRSHTGDVGLALLALGCAALVAVCLR